jgi:PAS domain S-box-containing protein
MDSVPPGNVSLDELRTIFASSMDGFLMIDMAGNIREANESYAQLSGYSREELLTMRVSSLDVYDGPLDVEQRNAEIMAQGTLRFETKTLHKGGAAIDVEVSATYSPLNGGSIFSFIRDVSLRKRTQELLAARLRLLEYSLDHTLDELLRRTLDEAEELTGSCIGFYHTIESDQQSLTLRAWSTRTSSLFCKAEGTGSHYPVSQAGVWIDCLHERRPVIHNDYATLPHRRGLPAGHAPVVRELVVPVFRGDKIVAVLGVGNKPMDYDQLDLDLVSRLADLAWDLARHKQAEEAIRRSEERYRNLVESCRDWIWEVDANGVYTHVSPQVEQIFGLRPEEVLGKTPFDLMPPEEADRMRSIFAEICLRREPFHRLENVNLRADGSPIVLETSGVPFFDVRGELLGYRGMDQDITERKQAEAEFYKLYQAVEQSPVALVITDLKGDMEYVNPAFCRLTGYGVEEAIGRNQRLLKSGRTTESEYRELWQTITGGGIWSGELCNRKKNGETYWERACIAPITDNSGIIRHFVAIKEDITPQKQSEQERLKLEAQLQQAQKLESVGRLAGGVAHDFNNILMVIQTYAHLCLMESDPSQQIYTFVKEIQKVTRRAADLTHQLLAFARKQTISPRVIDLNDTVTGMMKMMQRLIGENIQLSWHPAANLWPTLLDPSQMDQILANLCVNARDAIKDVGRIVIETRNHVVSEAESIEPPYVTSGEYVLLSVSDNGSGMDEDVLAHVFEPFFTTKGVGEGTGLGLATVYGIVKQNSGFIDVYSKPGRGTTFHIYLPRYAGGEAQESSGVTEVRIPRGRETILLVEDDEDILTSFSIMLEQLGYTVLAARNSSEAFDSARERAATIDLLVTDVVMPGMNGRDLADKLQSVYPRLKCLFMSGYTGDIVARHGVLESGVHFIQKPFVLADIAAKVRTVLDGP